ncbi:hypothetical protein O988_07397 [Pseudogymnoascus sp. VKM F-3808]|nr:hypothetical protein O988_07397 [Pseudogymnoascus sp. VKM F-3808]
MPAPRKNLAGPVQTVSLSDMQHDYFRITQATATTYSISLTTDPTPLFRIEVDRNLGADPAVQIFDLFNPLPLAAARLYPAVANTVVCTREPAGDDIKWRPVSNQGYSHLPMVVIPGMAAVARQVRWHHKSKHSTIMECWLNDPLFNISMGGSTQNMPWRDLLVARYGIEGVGFSADKVMEIRRGGGLEFELGIMVQAFAIVEADRRAKAKRGK